MNKTISDLFVRFLGEFIATSFLLFLGCMGCIAYDGIQNNHLQLSFAFGLVIMAMVNCFAVVSGGHMNPAVSVSAFIYKKITLPMLGVYFAGQMLGATAGYGLLSLLVPKAAIHQDGAGYLCVTVIKSDISLLQGLLIEFLATAVLILLCCSVWDPRNAQFHDSVSIKFGLTVSMLCCVAAPFTGCSMNPARTFGPAIVTGQFDSHWIYWIGPIGAAVVATGLYMLVFFPKAKEENLDN